MLKRVLLVLLIGGVIGGAQVTSSSVTVTASRTIKVQPDQAVFAVTLTTPLTTSREDAVSAVSAAGIAAANLAGVNTSNFSFNGVAQTVLQWSFSLPVSISDMKSTVNLLTSVAKGLTQKLSGFSMSFGVQTVQASPQLLQSQSCPVVGLLADARAQAQTLASSASMNLGTILAMSAPTLTGTNCGLTVKFSSFPY